MREPKPGEVWKNIGTGKRITIVRIEDPSEVIIGGIKQNMDSSNPVVVYTEADGTEGRWRLFEIPDPIGPDPVYGSMRCPAFTECHRRVPTRRKVRSAASK